MEQLRLNIQWAYKILRSTSFIVLTDKEATINIKGINPDKMKDIFVLMSQQSYLAQFKDRLEELIKAHDAAVSKVTGEQNVANKRTTAKKSTKSTTKSKAKVKK